MLAAVLSRPVRFRLLFTAATVDAESVSVRTGLTCRERRKERYSNIERPETPCKSVLKVLDDHAPVTFPKLMELVKQNQLRNPQSSLQKITSGQKLKKVLNTLKRTQRVFALRPGKRFESSHFIYHTGKGRRPNRPANIEN